MTESRGAAARYHSPFGFRQLRKPPADRFHQFIEMNVVARCGFLGCFYLRQGLRSGDDRERAFAIDQRADSDGLINVSANSQSSGIGTRGGSRDFRGAYGSACSDATLNGSQWQPSFSLTA
jgi:hypothetical protein